MNHIGLSEATTLGQLTSSEPGTRRKVGRFRETRRIRAVRGAFRILSKVTPKIAAKIAYGILAKPPRSREMGWQIELREKAQTHRLCVGGNDVMVYEWGTGPTVLMVHGWGARATHIGKMIDPLVATGFRVVSFDAPAHGNSSGRSTDLIEFAGAVASVAQHAGPIHTLIAHSFGVAMALFARRDWGLEVKNQVLISSFDHCKWFTEAFRTYIGIEANVMDSARQMMVERYSGRLDWERMSVVEMLRRTGEPTLIIHDKFDAEIPYQHSLSLLQAAPHARMFATSGLGHHRLLGNSDVIESVVQFACGENSPEFREMP